MNEIVIDLEDFSEPVQEELKDQAVRQGKPMKQLMAGMIEKTTLTILEAAGIQPGGQPEAAGSKTGGQD